jgi:hypothetical protein
VTRAALLLLPACFPSGELELPARDGARTLLVVIEDAEGPVRAHAYDRSIGEVAFGLQARGRAWALFYDATPAALELTPGPILIAARGRSPPKPDAAWLADLDTGDPGWEETDALPEVAIADADFMRCQADRTCGLMCDLPCGYRPFDAPEPPTLPAAPPAWPERLVCPEGQAHFLSAAGCEPAARPCAGDFPVIGEPITSTSALVTRATSTSMVPIVLGLRAGTTYELAGDLTTTADVTIIGCGPGSILRFSQASASGSIVALGRLELRDLRVESMARTIHTVGPSLVLDHVSVAAARAEALAVSAGTATARHAVIEGGDSGVYVALGDVTLEDTVVRDAMLNGVTCDPVAASSLRVRGLVVQDVASGSESLAAVVADDACSFAAEDLLVERSGAYGVFATRTSVTATRAVVRRTSDAFGAFGCPRVHIAGAHLTDAENQGLTVSRTRLVASDITVERCAIGIGISQGEDKPGDPPTPPTSASLTRAWVTASPNQGLRMDADGGGYVVGARIADITIEPTDEGGGVTIGDVADLTLERLSIRGGRTGVSLVGPEGDTVLRDVSIRGTSAEGVLLAQEDFFSARLERVAITGSGFGVRATRNLPVSMTVAATFEDLAVDMGSAPRSYGLLVEERADVNLERFSIRNGSIGIGAVTAPILVEGAVEACAVGAAIHEALDADAFVRDVSYSGNGIVLERRSALP